MNVKLQWLSPFKLAVAAAVAVATGAFGYAAWHARQTFYDPAVLLSRFPAEDAAVVSADFSALRRAGLLGSSKMALEPEYKSFLAATGFDYRRDLEQVTAAFANSGNYFIARGHFDWKKLREYALKQGGSCYRDLCRLEGSTPQRHISFLPLRDDVMALAVSTNDLAATRLSTPGQRVTASLPSAPVWISVSGAALRQPGLLPPGIRVMLSALANADRVLLTVQPLAGGMEARLDTTCRTLDDARILSSQLRIVATTLNKSKDDDLARALALGSFVQNDRIVTGRWPLSRTALDALASGI